MSACLSFIILSVSLIITLSVLIVSGNLHTDIHTAYIQRDKQTYLHIDRQHTVRQAEGWADSGRQTDGQTDRQTYRWTERQTDGWTDRLMDRQTDRQTYRQASFLKFWKALTCILEFSSIYQLLEDLTEKQ